jgi:hypothetical protein
MMQLPIRMQQLLEPRPKSVLKEVQDYLAGQGGRWRCLPHVPRPAGKRPRPRPAHRPR